MTEAAATKNLICVDEGKVQHADITASQKDWCVANGFEGKAGQALALPEAETGNIASYMFGMGADESRSPLIMGKAATSLPANAYNLQNLGADQDLHHLAFALGAYGFSIPAKDTPKAVLADETRLSAEMTSLRDAAFLTRDLINTPANILGPNEYATRIHAFAKERSMACSEIVGDELLAQNFPMIHTVGRASDQAPRLMDLSWGNENDPKLTLVGKGVTFDSGGLNIKPGGSMALMKKDMGGSANILGLAHVIVANKLPVRLRVLVPIVENAISSNAFRPSDVLNSRKGTTVEIGNTDAEGRLILADALTLAAEEEPELVIDMATLTGAARVALGFDIAAMFSTSDEFASDVVACGDTWGDATWRLPLFKGYRAGMASKTADINHISGAPYGGAIVAALFLEDFVEGAKSWAHFDISGWSMDAKPGRTVGGTDMGIRANWFALKKRFGG